MPCVVLVGGEILETDTSPLLFGSVGSRGPVLQLPGNTESVFGLMSVSNMKP